MPLSDQMGGGAVCWSSNIAVRRLDHLPGERAQAAKILAPHPAVRQ
jgi:hypothetical protein